MKKLLSALIAITVFFSCLSMVCFAATTSTYTKVAKDVQLLKNPGFENGDLTGWQVSTDQIELVTDSENVYSGSYAAKYTKRANATYTNQGQVFKITENELGSYVAYCWVKNAGDEDFKMNLTLKLDGETPVYRHSANTTIKAGGDYVMLAVSLDFNPSNYTQIDFYWTGFSTSDSVSFYLDECFFEKTDLNVRTSVPLDTELLENEGFENGSTDGWSTTSNTIELVTEKTNVNSGNYAAKLTKPAGTDLHWTNSVQILKSSEEQIGRYEASCYVKNADGDNLTLSLTIKLHKEKEEQATYRSSSATTLKAGEGYTKLSLTFWMRPSDYKYVSFYWTGLDDAERSFYIDDCSFKKVVEADSSNLDDFSNYIRTSKTSVGAIRWDAYYKTSTNACSDGIKGLEVSNQVARTLSNYQSQAPYFAKDNTGDANENQIAFKFVSSGEQYDYVSMKSSNMATLSTSKLNYTYGVSWNDEATYAMDAGIDYFAYLKYVSVDATNSPSQMSLPMLAHIAKDGYLDDGRQMKMCVIFSDSYKNKAIANDIDESLSDLQNAQKLDVDCKEIYLAMASSCYMTIPTKDGSRVAVMYYYDSQNTTSDQLEVVKNQARFFTAYLASKNPDKYTAVDDIYFIGMDGHTQDDAFAAGYNYNGFSAVSRYSTSAVAEEGDIGYETETMDIYEWDEFSAPSATDVTVKSNAYAQLVNESSAYNEKYADVSNYIQCVPLVTAGRSQVPRIKVSTLWTDDDSEDGTSSGHYGFSYTKKGTAAEIASHLDETIEWVQNNPDATLLNSVLMYAWNEHDEGGWLCPTAVCDDDGNIIFDADGNATADTSILDAVKTVLDKYDNDATVTVKSQNAPADASASVKYEKSGATQNDNVVFPDTLSISEISTGQKFTLTAEGDNFVGWYKVAGSKNIYISNSKSVTVTNNEKDETYIAVYKEDDGCTITFTDARGNVISVKDTADFTANDVPNAETGMSGIEFAGWMVLGQIKNTEEIVNLALNATDNITASAKYVISGKVNLTLQGEVKKNISGEYDKLSIVTIEANERDSSEKAFSYWKYTDSDGNDHILSTKTKYGFYITGDMTITAVYGEECDSNAEINITNTEKNENSIVVSIQRSVKKEFTVVEQGVLLTKNNGVADMDFVVGSQLISDGVLISARSSGTANNGVLIVTKLNVEATDNWRFRGYVVYKDNSGNTYTAYSKIIKTGE